MSLAAELRTLLEAVDAEFAPPLSTRVELAAYADKLARQAVVFGAYRQGAMAAFAAIYCNDAAGRDAYLSMLAVAPDQRGCGLSSQVLGAAIAHARARGFARMTLEVYQNNDAALAVYRKLGFLETGRQQASLTLTLALQARPGGQT